MFDILKKSITLALIAAAAVLIILGCYNVCRNAVARGEKQQQQQILISLFGASARYTPQTDSLNYPGMCWKISQPGRNGVHYAFALESAPEAGLPGGIVAVNEAGVISGVRLYASLEEALSLTVLVPRLVARHSGNKAPETHVSMNTFSNFGQRLLGISILKHLEIVPVRSMPPIPPINQAGAVLQENKIVVTPDEAPLYRQFWNELKPVAEAFVGRTYGSVIP